MQIVSDKWKNVHKQTLLNQSFVEISLDITDPDALAAARPSDNGAIYISDSSALTNGAEKNPLPYCTLEQNLWCLDGSRKAVPNSDFGINGYVSDILSDETCVFGSKFPTITLDFGGVFEKVVPGISIVWSETYNECADTFEIIAYNGNNVVMTKEVVGNQSIRSVIVTDIVDYDKIVIIIKKWCLPNHRARVEEIFVGINKVYEKGDLFGYSHKQTVDPVSTSLPKGEISFSVNNVNGEYNPYNAGGLSKYLTERQELKARYGLKTDKNTIEWIKAGTFYLSEWRAKQNGLTAEFTARDLLEFMSAIYYDNVSTISDRSLYDLAIAVLRSADLPLNSDGTVKWIVDESLKSIYTRAPLPQDTHANCLQLIANAGECTLYQDREGKLRIEPLKGGANDTSEDTDYRIDKFNSYTKSELTLSKPIKEVKVKVYTYTIGNDGLSSTTTDVTRPVGTAGEIITVDNPLITSTERATSLAKWLGEHLSHRKTLDSSWRVDVRVDPLDIVTNVNDYGTNRVRMTDIEFKFNGAFRGTGKGKVI